MNCSAELARLISRELSDPRLGFVTVMRVEITQDLHTAKVFVSIIGDRHVAGQSMQALESAKKFLRRRTRSRGGAAGTSRNSSSWRIARRNARSN